MVLKGGRKSKSPAFLSHEFIIQNHADIVSCFAMVIVLGLMFQITAPIASVFVTLSHNSTAFEDLHKSSPIMFYTNGWKDCGAIFFYCLIAIVIHAVIQEYILDKFSKKLHLSKTKLIKFNESGQMVTFTGVCTAMAIHILHRDGLLSGLSKLWEGYPKVQSEMTFLHKAFFITQIAYWIHFIPELYFLKVKKSEMLSKITYPLIMVFLTTAAYVTNFSRIALVLLMLRYFEDCIFHICKLLNYADKLSFSIKGFEIWNFVFVTSRLISFILGIVTFQYGLSGLNNQGFDIETGNFNSALFRFNALLGIVLSQGFLMFIFTHYLLTQSRVRQQNESRKKVDAKKTNELASKNKNKKSNKDKRREEENKLLPEADQHTRRRK